MSDNVAGISVPPEIVELVISLGAVQWGQTAAFDADGHGAHVAESVRLTEDHFQHGSPQHMHGLYLEGTGVVVCHTGTSPNSPQIARALTGAWNWLLGECAALNKENPDVGK